MSKEKLRALKMKKKKKNVQDATQIYKIIYANHYANTNLLFLHPPNYHHTYACTFDSTASWEM